jgi:periplasmic copper chaperone A
LKTSAYLRTIGAMLAVAAPFAALFAALFAAEMGYAADAPAGIEATEAWIRWLPAGLPAGGYVTLRNHGPRPQVLIGATSPSYASVSLHRMTDHDGTSQMQPVAQIELAPGAALSFATSGYHFMLEQATAALQPGAHVPITLRFAGGSALTVSFEVRGADSVPR